MAANSVTNRHSSANASGVPSGTFGEFGKLTEPVEARRKSAPSWIELSWEHEESEVQKLTLPSDVMPGDVFPDIESALLAAAEQLHRRPSQPELPPIADLHRRAK